MEPGHDNWPAGSHPEHLSLSAFLRRHSRMGHTYTSTYTSSHYLHLSIGVLEKRRDGRCHPYTHFFLQADEGTQLCGTKSGPLLVIKEGPAWEVASQRKYLKTQAVDSRRPGLNFYLGPWKP